ncbi:hypothetical protein B296_00040884 [Ensete ventricosum]|uniref:Uncharacterized protein n=1 Tax=Ensete ventricosum TaxID=4639 RepID=A0A426XL62_ENSVE|nr:hypothetical protein B296_00040884 [Ensete ventricosum]
MIGAIGELDYFSAYIRLREPNKSEDKTEAMSLAAPWYRRGGTSVESLIPCSYGERALVINGAEELENAEANSRYQDRGGRVEAKELHKTDVDGLLIKIAESEGLRIDARVLDQGMK